MSMNTLGSEKGEWFVTVRPRRHLVENPAATIIHVPAELKLVTTTSSSTREIGDVAAPTAVWWTDPTTLPSER